MSKSIRRMSRDELIGCLVIFSGIDLAFVVAVCVAVYRGERGIKVWLALAVLLFLLGRIVANYAGELRRRWYARSWEERTRGEWRG